MKSVATALLLCALPRVATAEDYRPAVFTIPEPSSRGIGVPDLKPSAIWFAQIQDQELLKILSRQHAEQPKEHRWLRDNPLAPRIQKAFRSPHNTVGRELTSNALIGRLRGDGVGPNWSYFTHGDSITIGDLTKDGRVQIEVNVTICGPLTNLTPMTHGVYFIIPLGLIPKATQEILVGVRPTHDWYGPLGEKVGESIEPPSYKGNLAIKTNQGGEQGRGARAIHRKVAHNPPGLRRVASTHSRPGPRLMDNFPHVTRNRSNGIAKMNFCR